MRVDDRHLAARKLLVGELGHHEHSSPASDFARDCRQEGLRGHCSFPFLEAARRSLLLRVPVVSLRLEPHHSYVVETVTTQYGVPMETLRALAVDLCVRDELRALGFVDEFELLGTERQRIDLDEIGRAACR